MKKKLLCMLLASTMLASTMTVSAQEVSQEPQTMEVPASQETAAGETPAAETPAAETPATETPATETPAEPPEETTGTDTTEGTVIGEEGEVTQPITIEDKPYLSLGANLSQEQQNTVLELLDINPAELSAYDVIYTTIDEEYQYLGNYLPAETIGKRSLSSVLVVKREQGHGINITTKNISYCTIGMYKNALITAGITDADIIVAAPFPISGTAALVGALKAYSVMTGEQVSEASMDAALNELVLTGDLAETLGDSQQVEEFIAYLKQQIVAQGLDSPEEIRSMIEEASKEFDITLSDEDLESIVSLLQKIGALDLDLDSLMSQAKDLYDKLADMGTSSGFFDKIADFFNSIVEFIKGLFS